jgi:uncharacterized protein (DUF934 family)
MRPTIRQVIKQRKIVADTWQYADEDASAGKVIVPLARFQQERATWLAGNAKLGVRIGAADSVDAIAGDLARLSLVAIEFGGIGEGRGYTHAQLLRRRYQFTGEVRAVGKIQRDQVFYMARCGFDTFEFPDGTDPAVALAAFEDFTVAYQPSSDRDVTLLQRAIG